MEKKKHPKDKPKQKYNLLIVAIILIAAGFIIYSNVLYGPFVFDDREIIMKNNDIKNGDIFAKINQGRYIGFITFAINYYFNGSSTFGYHLINIIIHIVNALLVYLLVQKIMLIIQNQAGQRYKHEIPLIVALIFLVHPIQTQAVAYIVQRFTSLAAFFSLASILSYLEFRTSKTKSYLYLILSFAACLLAFKTKENTAMLPFIIILIEFLLLKDFKFSKEKILYVLPFFLLFMVIPLSFINVNQPLGQSVGELSKASAETQIISRGQYLLTEFRVIMTYLRLLVLPIHQSIDYYYAISNSFFEIKTLLSFIFLCALFLFSLFISKKYPIISFGILWFFIFLAVESSVIPINDVIFEHRLYLPSIGFILAVVYSLFLIGNKFKLKWFLIFIFGAIIITLAIATISRNKLWNDELALWKNAMIQFPQNPRAVGNYGIILGEQGNCAESIEASKKAIELDPMNPKYWFAIATCHKRLGSIEDAINELSIVLGLNPRHQNAWFDLADIYMERKEFNKAYPVLRKAQQYIDHPYINSSLAVIYCESGKLNEAMILFESAVKVGLSSANAYFNFAVCLLNHSILKESRNYFFKVQELNPADQESYYFIAITYDREKDYQRAAYFYNRYLSTATQSSWISQAKARLTQLENAGIQPLIQ